jgi:glutamine---fructose-6-phosphate transaminase (isomerizing)
MCGIFGLISKNRNSNSGEIFKSLCLFSESRGKEAAGFAIINEKSLTVFKTPFPASEMVKGNMFRNEVLKSRHDIDLAFAAIGHSRLVTNGYEQDEKNNQPVVRNGYVVIHNGIIVNQAKLWKEYQDEVRMSELDSELIPVIISHNLSRNIDLGRSIGNLFTEIYGMTNIGMLSSYNDNLILATNNGSLYYIDDTENGFFVFASERYILEQLIKKHKLPYLNETVRQLLSNTMMSVTLSCESAIISNIGDKILNTTVRNCPLNIVSVRDESTQKEIYFNTSLEHEVKDVDKQFINYYEVCKREISKLRRCSKCILPATFPFIEFDDKGVCNYCNNYKKHIIKEKDELLKIADLQRRTDTHAECMIPFSGGRDSSYALHYVVKELELKPIAFSYDWGMLTDLARRNQARMCGRLGVEHILVSADIRRKRANIRKNVLAWLKKPSLGTVPLFMAGDKQYFYFANQLMKQNVLKLSILGENLLETTNFKSGFCGIKPYFGEQHTYSLKMQDKIKMVAFYGGQYILNPSYINSSLFDTLDAFRSYYLISHNNINIYDYIEWNEKKIEDTLFDIYDWETDPGTRTTWRIGDGTAAFYNYIYYIVAGFTENDTFRSNQIREGNLSRKVAFELSLIENQPRWDSIQWYCRTIGIDFKTTIQIINKTSTLYDK